ncbi:MAG: L-2-amino-thiazoline-4-carboxylic acid hydrolase [Bacteroidota bacterium]
MQTSKAEAYQFVKDCIQEGSRYMMAEFYEAEELAKFDDPYAAFWEYHKAMFRGDDNFDNELIEGDDCHRMIVHNCRSCAIAQLTISELGPMGCDHDITGFEAISEQIQMDFRRPTTLAKDGKPCEFMFFRKGTAPEGLETK